MLAKAERYFFAARPAFFTASLVPVAVAGAYVRWRGGVDLTGLWVLTALGLVLLHAAANLLNDYFDHLSGADEVNTMFVSPFTGGARFIQRGLLLPEEVLFAGLLCLATGSAVGLYLATLRGWLILGLGAFGVATLFFYTAPPLRLGYRGLGELIIGLDFGVLPMLGTEYVLTRHVSLPMVWVSVPVALLIIGVLWVNEFPDAEADGLVGKRHLVVILGRRAAAKVLVGLYVLVLLFTAGGVMLGWLPPAALMAMAAGLPAAQAAQALAARPDDPSAWRVACPRGVAAHGLYGLLMFLALVVSPTAPGLASLPPPS